jgi:hypothetical protein
MLNWRKIRRFCRTPPADRRLLVEAAILLGVARAAIVCIPFKHMVPWLAKNPADPNRDDAVLNQRVSHAITVAARHVLWNSVCLPQAIAAKVMLSRRGFASTLFLGTVRDAERGMIAHAWLDCGGTTVVGEDGKSVVVPVGRFG